MTGTTYWTTVASPLGDLLLAADDAGLTGLHMDGDGHGPHRPDPDWVEDPGRFDQVVHQLAEYFAGERTEFDLPINPAGTTFQRVSWKKSRVSQLPVCTYSAARAACVRSLRCASLKRP